MTITLENIKARNGSVSEALSLLIYPIGYCYCSAISTSPVELFGGTWVAGTDQRFFMSDNSTSEDVYNSNAFNFSHSHTFPSTHTHTMNHTHTLASHTHSITAHTHTFPAHTHILPLRDGGETHVDTLYSRFAEVTDASTCNLAWQLISAGNSFTPTRTLYQSANLGTDSPGVSRAVTTDCAGISGSTTPSASNSYSGTSSGSRDADNTSANTATSTNAISTTSTTAPTNTSCTTALDDTIYLKPLFNDVYYWYRTA